MHDLPLSVQEKRNKNKNMTHLGRFEWGGIDGHADELDSSENATVPS